jgi:hypothetical protein
LAPGSRDLSQAEKRINAQCIKKITQKNLKDEKSSNFE